MNVLSAATAATPSTGALTAANNLRIAALSVAAYDYLLTLPLEFRIYKSSNRRSLGLVLFILIRYSSIVSLVVSNVGFFYHHFSPKACSHYMFVSPIFKVFHIMISQAIMGLRAYNIARRNVWIGWTLLSTYVVVVAFQWVSSLFNRIL
ncbi:hypothetical protein B0F90DRAFT_1730031 [Multifurca ochricompacta]|uniref:DUF6533 domain-containing protein n=1 Tax=Multifurca ochricompacta TaxID=376703 RepID=A0AAD4QMK5_9AGAM|nr:hypothetical protein B0F90DRAFT_1730031 [Multifurca ochricompacta]